MPHRCTACGSPAQLRSDYPVTDSVHRTAVYCRSGPARITATTVTKRLFYRCSPHVLLYRTVAFCHAFAVLTTFCSALIAGLRFVTLRFVLPVSTACRLPHVRTTANVYTCTAVTCTACSATVLRPLRTFCRIATTLILLSYRRDYRSAFTYQLRLPFTTAAVRSPAVTVQFCVKITRSWLPPTVGLPYIPFTVTVLRGLRVVFVVAVAVTALFALCSYLPAVGSALPFDYTAGTRFVLPYTVPALPAVSVTHAVTCWLLRLLHYLRTRLARFATLAAAVCRLRILPPYRWITAVARFTRLFSVPAFTCSYHCRFCRCRCLHRI